MIWFRRNNGEFKPLKNSRYLPAYYFISRLRPPGSVSGSSQNRIASRAVFLLKKMGQIN